MSKAKITPAPSNVKQSSGSSKISKPVPTQWKERLHPEDYE